MFLSSSVIVPPEEEKLAELVEIVTQHVVQNISDYPLIPRMDPEFIAKFLRCKKYRPKEAIIAIEKYYKSIYSYFHVFNQLKVEHCQKTYELNAFKILKYPINQKYGIYINFKHWDTKVSTLRELEHAAIFTLEEFLTQLPFQIHGGFGIIDVSAVSFSHIRQLTFYELKHLFVTLQEMFPLRVGGIHVLHIPKIFWPIYSISLKLLPPKLKKRVHLHCDIESLVSALDPNALPKSLGGYLDEDEAYCTDIISDLIHRNPAYHSYWNGDSSSIDNPGSNQ